MRLTEGLQSCRVLVADEDGAICQLLCDTLRRHGVQYVAHAHAARDVVDELARAPYDALVLGRRLRDIDSCGLTEMIRSGRCVEPRLPIVIALWPDDPAITESLARECGAIPARLEDDASNLPEHLHDGLTGIARPNVLLIEDDPDAADIAQSALQGHYNVEVVFDGAGGLQRWRAKRHHLVCLDVMLPHIGGQEVLDCMISERPQQPVLIITAYGTQARYKELMLRGASDFLQKPYRIEQLRDTCRRVLRRTDDLKAIDEAKRFGEIGERLEAANYWLDRGRQTAAKAHVNKAAQIAGRSLTDDHWAALLSEFSDR